jgi:hypothetical protein
MYPASPKQINIFPILPLAITKELGVNGLQPPELISP